MYRKLTIAATFSLLLIPSTQAQTASIMVAERECSDLSLTHLKQSLGNNWFGNSSEGPVNNNRGNVSDSKCTATDIQEWLTSLQSSCSTYFDIVTLTPITKGHAEVMYHNDFYANDFENSRFSGYGYSYTDRLVMTYRCL